MKSPLSKWPLSFVDPLYKMFKCNVKIPPFPGRVMIAPACLLGRNTSFLIGLIRGNIFLILRKVFMFTLSKSYKKSSKPISFWKYKIKGMVFPRMKHFAKKLDLFFLEMLVISVVKTISFISANVAGR